MRVTVNKQFNRGNLIRGVLLMVIIFSPVLPSGVSPLTTCYAVFRPDPAICLNERLWRDQPCRRPFNVDNACPNVLAAIVRTGDVTIMTIQITIWRVVTV